MYKYIQNYLSQIQNPTIFELGMHWGEDTMRMINWCNSTPDFHGFEPDPRNVKKIKERNLPITFNQAAISDQFGRTTLYLSDGLHPTNKNHMTGANSIRKPKEVKQKHKWIDFENTCEVETWTVDAYCEEYSIDKIDFIWSDIQGAEHDMLVGAKEMLPNIGLMMLEYSHYELYEGQKNLNEILTLLGSNWKVIEQNEFDILVRNDKY
jgi:FkbM family methyltransferase